MANFVLVHGSYQGGWIWQRVALRLRAAGHTVFAPNIRNPRQARRFPGHGLAGDGNLVPSGPQPAPPSACGHYPMLTMPDELTRLIVNKD